MAYEGANAATQQEFENVFGFEEDNAKFIAEMERLKSVADISNSIWILTNYEVLKSYTDTIESKFNAAPNYTDFKKDSEGSANKINAWIEKSTNGMIKKMLSASNVVDFKMALVNAIYFKQDWKYTFDKKLTKEDEFTNENGTKVEIEMMHSERSYRAFAGTREKVIELPYDDNETSMIILLPNKMEGYSISNESYNDLISNLAYQMVDFDLPKFTFETPTFELKTFLAPLGLSLAFSDTADFTGMRKQNDLKIGTALNKAKIIVNEEGTEAAAATVIGMMAKTTSVGPPPAPIMKMRVDKPFYYFIKDNKTGTILFMGRMNAMQF